MTSGAWSWLTWLFIGQCGGHFTVRNPTFGGKNPGFPRDHPGSVGWDPFLGAVLCLKFVFYGFPLVLGFRVSGFGSSTFGWKLCSLKFTSYYVIQCPIFREFTWIYHHSIAIWTCPNLRRFTNTIIYGSETWDFGELDSQQPAIRGFEWVSSEKTHYHPSPSSMWMKPFGMTKKVPRLNV